MRLSVSLFTITGAVSLSINTVTDPLTSGEVYNVTTTLAFNNVGTEDDFALVVVDGSMNIARNANGGNFSETASDAAPLALSVSEGGTSTTLTSFSIDATRTPTGITIGSAGNTSNLEYSEVTDPLSISILSQLEGTDFQSMYAGSFRITASDNISLTLAISTDGQTTLAVDSDGDGTTDDTLQRN
ncbi:hypothetical protein [Kaarinaea lacus]